METLKLYSILLGPYEWLPSFQVLLSDLPSFQVLMSGLPSFQVLMSMVRILAT